MMAVIFEQKTALYIRAGRIKMGIVAPLN